MADLLKTLDDAVQGFEDRKGAYSPYFYFEPWDCEGIDDETAAAAFEDGVDLEEDPAVRLAGEYPRPFQTGSILSNKEMVCTQAGSRSGKTICSLVVIGAMISRRPPYSFRFEKGVDTGIARQITEENITRFGRRDKTTGAIIDKDPKAKDDGSWDCGNIIGAGIFPEELYCPKGRQIWIGTVSKSVQTLWWPSLTGSGKARFLPQEFIDTTKGNKGSDKSQGIVYAINDIDIHIKTYDMGHIKFESETCWLLNWDEEPPKPDIYVSGAVHAEYQRFSFTPLCLPGDIRVATKRGMLQIKDVKVGDIVCVRDRALAPVVAVHKNGKQQLWEITTARGRVLRCTGLHKWLAAPTTEDFVAGRMVERRLRPDVPNRRMVEAQQLTTGDWLDISTARYAWPTQCDVTVSDGYFMGQMVGDGSWKSHWSNGPMKLTTADTETLLWTAEYLVSKGLEPRVYEKKGMCASLEWCSAAFGKVLESWGVVRTQKTDTKRVPEAIWRGTKEVVRAFLQGYFDADGSCRPKRCNVSACTTSEELAQDVVQLLSRFSVLCRIQTRDDGDDNHGTQYHIDITGANARRYLHRIGFRLARKQDRPWKGKENGIGNSWDMVASVRPLEVVEDTYEITVDHTDHTFMAGGYTSGNSGRSWSEELFFSCLGDRAGAAAKIRKGKGLARSDFDYFYASQFDSPFVERKKLQRDRRGMELWQRQARIWGQYSEYAGEPFFNREKIHFWQKTFKAKYIEARLRPSRGFVGMHGSVAYNQPGILGVNVLAEPVKEDDEKDVWRIYEKPRKGVGYMGIFDSAEGAVDPEKAKDRNFGLIVRLPDEDREDEPDGLPVVVATIRSTLPTVAFARVSLLGLRYYNNALLAAERGHGKDNEAFGITLEDWPWWYIYVSNDAKKRSAPKKGFDTNKTTRSVCLSLLRDWTDSFEASEDPCIRDERIYKELAEAITKETMGGKLKCDHPRSGSLDGVICLGIATYILHETPDVVVCNDNGTEEDNREGGFLRRMWGKDGAPQQNKKRVFGQF